MKHHTTHYANESTDLTACGLPEDAFETTSNDDAVTCMACRMNF